jgi:PKD repeat protein
VDHPKVVTGRSFNYAIKVVLEMKLRRYLLACIVLVIALTVFAMPVSGQLNVVPQNGTVLLGEEGLDVTAAVGSANYLGWWSGSDYSTPPTRQIDLAGYVLTNFNIDDGIGSPFVGTEGKGSWWRLNASGEINPTQRAFSVVSPQATLKIRNLDYGTDVTGSTALIGDTLDFELNPSTLHYIFLRDPVATFNCKIVVRSPGGVTYSKLWTDVSQRDLTFLDVNSSPWYWSSGDGIAGNINQGWKTDAVDLVTSLPVYSAGVYQVTIECNQNSLGFVGTTKTVTLEEEQPVLTVAPSTLIRGNKFFTTVEGIPNTYYIIWIQGCSVCPGCCSGGAMSGICCDQPPMMVEGQEGVFFKGQQIEWNFGQTIVLDCGCACTNTVYGIVPHSPADGKYYYALVLTDENGERTIEWQTTNCTAPMKYKIHTQRWIPADMYELDLTRPFAEACVNVQKGVVTLNTEVCGEITDQTYLGETVRLYGTNSDSKWTYLFITGPCQSCAGENMEVTKTVVNGVASTFTVVPVKSDGTWEYYWYTRNLQIDLGQYTIYASSMPNDAPALEGVPCHDCSDVAISCAAWTKKPFTFLEPTITADINPKILKIVCCAPTSIIVSGEAAGLRGEAIGQAYNTVPLGIWVFGENKVAGLKYWFDTVYVDCPTGQFSYDLSTYIDTLGLQPGTYKVIVQHPMYNHRLDIIPETRICEQSEWYWWFKWGSYIKDEIWYPDANRKFVVTATPVRWSKLFVIDGPDRLVGSQALNALLIGFQDPNIDDNIVTLTFKVESNTALSADFSGSPVSGNAPLTVQFTDISTGTPSSWLWYFGDGSTSTNPNPSHIYLEPGTYDVTLQVSNSGGSSATTKANYITVYGVSPTVTPTQPPVSGSTINLYTGWNFVSTPRILADGKNTIGTVFVGVTDRPVYLYDAATGMWQILGNSSMFKPLDGVWIYSTGTKQAPLTFKNDPLATPPTKAVYSGWNAIGFSDVTPAAAKDTLQSVSAQWVSAIGFNAAAQSYESSIIKGGSGSHADTNPMYPTKGYWLFMNADGTLAAISA